MLDLDLDLYLEHFRDLGHRLGSDDPAVREAAHRAYERYARAPNFAAALMADRSHVTAARLCLRRGERLTMWERGFLESLARMSSLSARQSEVLSTICFKSSVRWTR